MFISMPNKSAFKRSFRYINYRSKWIGSQWGIASRWVMENPAASRFKPGISALKMTGWGKTAAGEGIHPIKNCCNLLYDRRSKAFFISITG
jgi:hypothetical protein